MGDSVLEHSEVQLTLTHNPRLCEGRPCALHHRTDHSMRHFPQHFRTDNGLIERVCPHGVGHPDPDSIPFFAERGVKGMEKHGCDGCCHQA